MRWLFPSATISNLFSGLSNRAKRRAERALKTKPYMGGYPKDMTQASPTYRENTPIPRKKEEDSSNDFLNPLNPLNPLSVWNNDSSSSSNNDSFGGFGGGDFGGGGAGGSWDSGSSDSGGCDSSISSD